MNGIIGTASLLLVMLTTLTIIWSPRWRWVILALAVQYGVVFLLVSQVWPFSLAAVKLIAGWMAGAVLGASQGGGEGDKKPISLAGRLFRIFASFIIFVVIFSITQEPPEWLPVAKLPLTSGLILISMGLFQLGLAARPLQVIIGLLTALSGFEVIYAAVVSSVLVAGLLTMMTLGLALAGAYWMVPQTEEEKT